MSVNVSSDKGGMVGVGIGNPAILLDCCLQLPGVGGELYFSTTLAA
jgi:hypothetical protein